jgi:L-ascorbate metabolism protein UlaG (beta-lactamase superfamily)
MMTFSWIGQAGYLVETDTVRFVIDPYLSNAVEERQGHARLIPPPIGLEELVPDYLIITHDHLDHYDPVAVPQIMVRFSSCVLVGPESVIAHARKDGVSENRLRAFDAGQTIKLADAVLTAMPTRHSDPCGIGLLIETGNDVAYMSGDTEFYPELLDAICRCAPSGLDAGFVVINGRWGNMNHHEAAGLMAAVGARLCVPLHYGMFASNTVDPEDFVRACAEKGLRVKLPVPGIPFSIPMDI